MLGSHTQTLPSRPPLPPRPRACSLSRVFLSVLTTTQRLVIAFRGSVCRRFWIDKLRWVLVARLEISVRGYPAQGFHFRQGWYLLGQLYLFVLRSGRDLIPRVCLAPGPNLR